MYEKAGVCDEKECSGRQIPVNKYATAHLPKGKECPSQMSQAALSDGQSLGEGGLLLGGGGETFAWGGGGGGGESQVSHPPCMKP